MSLSDWLHLKCMEGELFLLAFGWEHPIWWVISASRKNPLFSGEGLWYPRPDFPPTLMYEQNPLGTSAFAFRECQEFWRYSAWSPSVWSRYHKRMPKSETSPEKDCRPHLLLFVSHRRIVRMSRSRLTGTASSVSGFDEREGELLSPFLDRPIEQVEPPPPPYGEARRDLVKRILDTLGIFFNLSSWTLFLFC